MSSIRTKLVLGTAVGTTAVLLLCGLGLYVLIGRTLWAEFDEALATRARALTALAEQDGDRVDFELTELSLPQFEPSEHPEYYQLWQGDGAALARSPSLGSADLEPAHTGSRAPVFQMVTLPSGRPGRTVSLTFLPRQDRVPGAEVTPLEVTLVLGREVASVHATLGQVRAILLAVGVVAVLLSAGVLALIVHRGMRPLGRLSREIAQVGAQELSTRISAEGVPTEMRPVVERLNELLARLEAAFRREQRFTGDVAHELRTPIAGLRAKLELALAQVRDPEAYQNTLRACLEIDLHMQSVVQNLLCLARADAGQLELQRTEVDLAALIRECQTPLEQAARDRRIKIDWRLAEIGVVETDKNAVQLIVQNLLDNAATYVDDGGQVVVSLASENGDVVFNTRNTGSTLAEGEARRVFERFWRADSSHRNARGSHCGLGLPLCQAVSARLGGSLEVTTSPTTGVFEVTFRLPAADANDHRPE